MSMELRKRGIPFEHIDLSDDCERAAFYGRTDTRTVPQLFLAQSEDRIDSDGVRLGGWDAVKPILDELASKLE